MEVTIGAPTTRELLVAFGLCLCAITAGNRGTACRFRDHATRSSERLLIAVPAMNGIVAMEEVSEENISGQVRDSPVRDIAF